MRTSAQLDAPCDPAELFTHVAALDRYPAWMHLVHRAEPEEPLAESVQGGGPAWIVELRARVGPLARSKRLRMVRTAWVADRLVRFERAELDGRAHAPWILTAELTPTGQGVHLDVELVYGGSLWTGGVLERILDDEIGRARDRLLALVSAGSTR